jgi:hypothetical protein
MRTASADAWPGYAIYGHVFERAEIVLLRDALAHSCIVRSKAGARHLLSVPAVLELASDARLIHLAARLVWPSALPFRATLFDVPGIQLAGCVASRHGVAITAARS